jgi:Ca2+-binding RTX toxin-like protein
MKSKALQKFINESLLEIDATSKVATYMIGSFKISNNGLMLDGTNKADNFVGGALNDILWGNQGSDNMRGGGGRDLLIGGHGHDILHGDDGDDRLEGRNDNDKLFGGKGNDALFGGTGNDMLFGGNGNDYLCAGSGNDVLIGGAGRDTFVFRPELGVAASTSTYTDFTIGQDKLKIEDYLLPKDFSKSAIGVEADGDLFIATAGGHRLVFESLDSNDINGLYNAITLI